MSEQTELGFEIRQVKSEPVIKIESKTKSIKLNLACGKSKIPGYINIDAEDSVEPDLVCNILKGLPYQDNKVDQILFFHAIEHIEEKYHRGLLAEFWRILKPDGSLLMSYPEFSKCAQNYIDNYRGMKDFWKNTIYGLQRYPGDFHVSLMDSRIMIHLLRNTGYKDIIMTPEPSEPYNTVLRAIKCELPKNYEQILSEELDLVRKHSIEV